MGHHDSRPAAGMGGPDCRSGDVGGSNGFHFPPIGDEYLSHVQSNAKVSQAVRHGMPGRQADRKASRQSDRQTDRQADMQTDRQADKQADR